MKLKEILLSKKFWVELFIMTVCMLIAAIAVHFFLVPSKLIIGSISGLSIVGYKLTGIPVSLISFGINMVLLVLAYILIGKEFGLKTVYSALLLSPWLYLLERNFPVSQSIMQDPWFDLLCFVITLSITQAILFRINASTGGLDIVAKIINKYLNIDIGTSVTIAGGAICCSALLINDFKLVLIGLIGTWVNGLVLNHFSNGFNMKKKVCIVSHECDRIKDFIIHKLNRGVTMYEVKGGYSSEMFTEINAILTKHEFADLMKFINLNKIKIFMTVNNVGEIYGLWNNEKRGKSVLPKK